MNETPAEAMERLLEGLSLSPKTANKNARHIAPTSGTSKMVAKAISEAIATVWKKPKARSITALAKKSGRSANAIHLLKKDGSSEKTDVLIDVCSAMGIDPDAVMRGEVLVTKELPVEFEAPDDPDIHEDVDELLSSDLAESLRAAVKGLLQAKRLTSRN